MGRKLTREQLGQLFSQYDFSLISLTQQGRNHGGFYWLLFLQKDWKWYKNMHKCKVKISRWGNRRVVTKSFQEVEDSLNALQALFLHLPFERSNCDHDKDPVAYRAGAGYSTG